MAGGAAVISDHKARNVHRFKVAQGEAGKTGKIVIVPASVGCTDQPTAISIVGEDDSIVSEGRDNDGRLRTGGGTRRGSDRSF